VKERVRLARIAPDVPAAVARRAAVALRGHVAAQHNAGAPVDHELAEFARLLEALARVSDQVPVAVPLPSHDDAEPSECGSR
jgi:hypothetical protein